MMKAVADDDAQGRASAPLVSLNPIMIDGTGMCGGCRVLVDGKSEFACVDGPEFDAHRVNFDVLVQRNTMYRDAEAAGSEGIQVRPGIASRCRSRRRRRGLRRRRSQAMTQPAKPSLNPLPLKERMKVPRQPMPEQPAELRAHNFNEVNLGYSRGTGAAGSTALPGMRQARLHGQLSCGRESVANLSS